MVLDYLVRHCTSKIEKETLLVSDLLLKVPQMCSY